MRAFVLCALVATVAGCRPDFDPASYIGKLRLLAVVATPPNPGNGETSTLAAHYFDPMGQKVAISWDVCLLPPTPSTGAINPDCIASDMGVPRMPLPPGDTTTVTMPTFASVPAALAQLGLPDGSNGVYLPVRLSLTAGDRQLTALYRLRWHADIDANPPNNNPVLDGIFQVPVADAGMDQQLRIDDAATPAPVVEVRAHDKIYLRATIQDGSSERYTVYDSFPPTGPPRTVYEKVKVSWYATAGSFSNDATGPEKPDTTWTLDKHLPSSGTLVHLWTVAQDERGGTDLRHAVVTFR
jgi:hypothetical protein